MFSCQNYLVTGLIILCILLYRCPRKSGHVLNIVTVKASEATIMWFLPYERWSLEVLFILCIVPSTHKCAHAPNWATLQRLWRPVDSCCDGIQPIEGWLCVVDARNKFNYKCSKEVQNNLLRNHSLWKLSEMGGTKQLAG